MTTGGGDVAEPNDREEPTLKDLLELMVKLRQANEQRNYWYLLAYVGAVTAVVTQLKDLKGLGEPSTTLLGVGYIVLGLAALGSGIAAAIAHVTDHERIRVLATRLQALKPKDERPLVRWFGPDNRVEWYLFTCAALVMLFLWFIGIVVLDGSPRSRWSWVAAISAVVGIAGGAVWVNVQVGRWRAESQM